jgi:ATP-dependent DNA helicase RecQ
MKRRTSNIYIMDEGEIIFGDEQPSKYSYQYRIWWVSLKDNNDRIYGTAYAREKQQAEQKFPELTFIKKTYRGLCNYLKVAIGSGKNETYNCDIKKFCNTFNLPINDTYHAIKFLELSGEMVFSEGVYHPTKVKFAIGNTALYNFQLQNETLNPLIVLLSRSYPGVFDSYFDLHEKEFCKRLSVTPIQLEKQLKTLEQYGVIDVSWRSDLPTVTFLRERLPDDYLELKPEIYLHRKEIAQSKLKACIEYLTVPKCRAQQLINYFGITSEKCGKCDVCSKEKNTISDKTLSAEIIQLLKISPLSIRQLMGKLNNHKQIDEVLRSLILDEKIRFENEIYHLI